MISVLLAFFLILATNRIPAQTNILPECEGNAWDKIRISKGDIPEGTANIFVITNRAFAAEAKNQEYFPNDIADSLSYFIAVCNGTTWQLHFVSGFEEGMKEINDGHDMLIFLEGHGKTLPMSLDRAYQVQARYNISMIVFDWPSDNRNFNSSLHAIRGCEENFYTILMQMKEYRKQQMNESQHLSILAHSMGNYFLIYSAERNNGTDLSEVFADNIVMNAPAIPSKDHGKSISQMAFQKRIYITLNKNDLVLRSAGALRSSMMLGNVAFNPLAENAHYINFNGVAGTEHSYYYGHQSFEHTLPAFYFFYNTSLHGNEVDFSDSKMFVPRKDGKGYNINGTGKRKKNGT
jgi:hypothetical protein